MKMKREPRALSQQFGEKLSLWLEEMRSEIISIEDFKENTFNIFDFSQKEGHSFNNEEAKLIGKLSFKILSLAFLLEKNGQEVEQFYEDYHFISDGRLQRTH